MVPALLLIGAGLLVSVAVDRVDVSPLVRAVRGWRDDRRDAQRVARPIRARMAHLKTQRGN